MSMALAVIVMMIVLMVLFLMVFLTVMRKKNTSRADGSIPKLGDADLFSGQPLQRKSRQRKSTAKPTPSSSLEEDIFKVPDSTF